MQEKVSAVLCSNAVIQEVKGVLEDALGSLSGDPVSRLNLVRRCKGSARSLRDEILWENLETYLINVYRLDDGESGAVKEWNLKLADILAQQSPLKESGYEGNEDQLRESSKRILKLIDDAGTKQKCVYYANLTRAMIARFIERDKFFKLCNCIRTLTEEDLLFLSSNLNQTGMQRLSNDSELIDDFRALGLVMEVNGGFAYTRRAYELLKYGLRYEENIQIPDEIEERLVVGSMTENDVQRIVSGVMNWSVATSHRIARRACRGMTTQAPVPTGV